MTLTDEEFREQYKPLYVPASYGEAQSVQDKVIFALADIGEGTADDITRRLEKLDPGADHKPLIAAAHEILTGLYEKGQIAGNDKDGDLVYNLHKITTQNNGAVNPDLLAPGLD